MNIFFSLAAVFVLIIAAVLGAGILKLESVFGIIIPYVALLTFIGGIIGQVIKWARSPVPFHIPTVAGQQKSLPWIKSSKLESPSSTLGVIGRMLLEILFFRSLFRNTKAEIKNGPKLAYGSNKYLWLGAIIFHWSFLIIVLRHFRFFTEPIPSFVITLQNLDGLFQIGLPVLFITDALISIALLFLLFRRILDSAVFDP
jgi:nitrate reductase gamma subunit